MSDEPISISIPGRLSPEDHAALFAKHGVKPIRNQFIVAETESSPPCGCAVGIRLVECAGSVAKAMEAKRDHHWTVKAILAISPLPTAYLGGLNDGFTLGHGSVNASGYTFEEYRAGLADGIAISKLVF